MTLTHKAIARSAGYIAYRTSGQFKTRGWYYMCSITKHVREEVYSCEEMAYEQCCINEWLINE